ncbi:hypothetical protein HNE05_13020 [Aquipseudomonas campi]|uniref:Uncharacterized protein n=1 Tax=Aquipseudomonas campi TaxID=2731681 RepID=A0A6M8FDE6_9GAMM|nr:hypothetical protein [Pseudomonas campi]QKE64233.1 hypothetical protein HNE05_13020 [Pseudomonas campi]
MKIAVIIGLSLFTAWAAMAIIQLWFEPLTAEVFVKLSVTAGVVEVVVLIVALVIREYCSEKELKSKGYLD